jgi:hypothetical protein
MNPRLVSTTTRDQLGPFPSVVVVWLRRFARCD